MIDTRTAPYAALLLRVALGVMFLAHGLLKVFVFGVPGTVAFFQSVGFPGWLAYATIAAEVAGGAMLLFGVYSRVVALALLPVLLGALFVHAGNGWLFSAANGGWEYPAFLAAVALGVALLGEGRFALVSNRVRSEAAGARPAPH